MTPSIGDLLNRRILVGFGRGARIGQGLARHLSYPAEVVLRLLGLALASGLAGQQPVGGQVPELSRGHGRGTGAGAFGEKVSLAEVDSSVRCNALVVRERLDCTCWYYRDWNE